MRRLDARLERWPLLKPFVISRGAKTEAAVVCVTLSEAGAVGRGEGVPYPRYGESPESVLGQIEAVRAELESGADRARLQEILAAGAARNALDCALWDLEAKAAGVPVWRLAGLPAPRPVDTAYTISLGTPAEMAAAAHAAAVRPLLKIKIGGAGDLARLEAVRRAAPASRLIVDANEGLSLRELQDLAPRFADLGVELVEQPLPADRDADLEGWTSPVRLCADESLHTRADLPAVAGRYGAVNVKLDKTGGLTEAAALASAARALGLELMVGCMVATSLAMAPALLLAGEAAVVDLDGPLLLARDRDPGLRFEGSRLHPPEASLWG